MSGLSLGPGVDLPLEAVTETFAILANRGKGKSSTAHVLVEELYSAGLPVVVLDVKGDWWGLRSSVDGKAAGLAFVVFGGDHADVPLEPTAGELIADVVVDHRISCVIDLSLMSKTKARQFATAFAERLYRRNRDALHLVVDEADVLIPQRATAETARLLGAMEDLAKRGRSRGIGLTIVTQRPQEVAKSVLDLCETLLLLGMTGPRSIKAVREWIEVNADEDASALQVVQSLPALEVGDAWVWSPALLRIQRRFHVRRIRTFDSHATPRPGERTITPSGRAAVDLVALGEEIAATVERSKADDPKALRARIAELEQHVCPEPVIERVEVPVLSVELVDQLEAALAPAHDLIGEAKETLLKHRMWAEEQLDTRPPVGAKEGEAVPRASGTRASSSSPAVKRTTAGTPNTERMTPGRQPSPGSTPPAPGSSSVSGPQQRILDSLAWFGSVGINPVDRGQLALHAGVSAKSSAYGNNLGSLRTAGLIDYPRTGQVTLTSDGHNQATVQDVVTTSAQLQDRLYSRLPRPQARILEQLVAHYPESVDRTELAAMVEASPTSSAYGNNLGALRTLGLIDYPDRGWVAAQPILFIGGQR